MNRFYLPCVRANQASLTPIAAVYYAYLASKRQFRANRRGRPLLFVGRSEVRASVGADRFVRVASFNGLGKYPCDGDGRAVCMQDSCALDATAVDMQPLAQDSQVPARQHGQATVSLGFAVLASTTLLFQLLILHQPHPFTDQAAALSYRSLLDKEGDFPYSNNDYYNNLVIIHD